MESTHGDWDNLDLDSLDLTGRPEWNSTYGVGHVNKAVDHAHLNSEQVDARSRPRPQDTSLQSTSDGILKHVRHVKQRETGLHAIADNFGTMKVNRKRADDVRDLNSAKGYSMNKDPSTEKSRFLSQYIENEKDEVADHLAIGKQRTSVPDVSVERLQYRLRQGLQPRRHVPTLSRVEAISQWQASQAISNDEHFDGLEIPKDRIFKLNREQPTDHSSVQFESDNEDWGEGSLGIRHASKMAKSHRDSMASSLISTSNVTTDISEDDLDGLELFDQHLDMRKRFQKTSERRLAGETIRCAERPQLHELEHLADGLIVERDSFRQAPRTIRVNAEKLSINATTRHTDLGSKFKSVDAPNLTNCAVQKKGRSHNEMPSGTRILDTTDFDRAPTNRQVGGLQTTYVQHQTQTMRQENAIRGQISSTGLFKLPRPSQSRPAFLPSGPARDSSHHVSALHQRLDRLGQQQRSVLDAMKSNTSPAPKRRATASEALRLEALRCSTRSHTRARTHGENHELDDFCDSSRRTSRDQGSSRATPVSHGTCTQPIIDNTRHKTRKKYALPGLISGINTTPVAKIEKNMIYNPKTFRWEGNETSMSHFDEAVRTPPRPALISHVSSSHTSSQLVNGMMYDPEHMRWIKVSDEASEIDPFELDDAKHNPPISEPAASRSLNSSYRTNLEHFTIGEEFDVGRQFIRKQREEESRWRSQTKGWFVRRGADASRAYLQDIYTLLMEDD